MYLTGRNFLNVIICSYIIFYWLIINMLYSCWRYFIFSKQRTSCKTVWNEKTPSQIKSRSSLLTKLLWGDSRSQWCCWQHIGMSEILGDSKCDSATEKCNQQTGNMLFQSRTFTFQINLRYLLHWKPFKNDKNCFSSDLKSSFR